MLIKRGLACTAVSLCALTLAADDHAVHWGYEGASGPDHWASLSESWATCTLGKSQSPIDLRANRQARRTTLVRAHDKQQMDVAAKAIALDLVDNGHTIQVTSDVEIDMQLDDESYRLVQFHFHSPSEQLELLTTQLHDNARPIQPLGDREVLLVSP